MISTILTLLLLQQVYAPSEFTQAPGASLQARYDAAIAQGRRGSEDTFWVAYRFPVKPGVRIQTWDNNVNISISSSTTSDGIEWIPNDAEIQRVGIFLLLTKSDGAIQRPRLINLNQNFRVHDRKVYWLGEPNAEESLTLLSKFVTDPQQKSVSSFANYMTLHDSPNVAPRLLQIARDMSFSPQVRATAINYLGREVSRSAGEELDKLASDPSTDIQRQAVSAISRRTDDEAIPSLIRIARTHTNPAVRQEAIRLLGQKKDLRVLDFFEELLKKK